MLKRLKEIAEAISTRQNALHERVRTIRKQNTKPEFSDEEKLWFRVSPIPLDLTVCGIDSGLLFDRVHGIDLLLTRTVGVRFTYKESVAVSFDHFPKRFPELKLEIRTGEDEHGAMLWKSLSRLRQEISAAASAIEKFSPQMILLDGSILPLPSDRPSENTELFPLYAELVSDYKSLYAACDRHGCQLAGVIKDSRAHRFAEFFKEDANVSDSMFVDSLLDAGERTCAFQYSAEKKQPIIKDLGEYSERFNVFYIKPSGDDIPLRIEYLKAGKTSDELASLLHSLSSESKTFAYPAVLIEADMCAALSPEEMENVKQTLFRISNGAVRPLRRNARPFR